LATLYYDETEKINSNDAVSRQRYSMTYRKEQNRKTPFPDNGIVWHTGKSKLEWRCF